MIYKQKDITANINNKSVNIGNIGVNFYTEDEETASIRLNIKNNGQAIDLDKINMKPKLDIFCSDGSIFIDEKLEVILAQQGIIQYAIPSKVIKHAGNIEAKLFLESETESVHVANFSFTIVDSGVEGKVQKEISVNLVKDTVERIMSEDLTVLLDSGFKEELTTDVQTYLKDNNDIFKGEKGDTGVEGPQGVPGEKGESFKYSDFTTDQLNNLKGPKGDPFQYTDFTQTQLDALKGPKGEQGIPGKDGVIPDTTNWQKYKMIPDNGTTGITNLNNDLEIMHSLKAGYYYTTNTPGILTGGFPVTTSAGFMEVLIRDSNMKRLTFRPYNSSVIVTKYFYNTWSEWERVNVSVSDTGWLPLTLLNNIQNSTQANFSFGQVTSYRVVTVGNIKRVSVRGAVTNVSGVNGVICKLPSELIGNDIPVFSVRGNVVSKNTTIYAATDLSINFYASSAIGTTEIIQFYGSWYI